VGLLIFTCSALPLAFFQVVEYKQQSRLEEKRKKALDLHLSFIVDQTEKYSSWLTEGLGGGASAAGSTSSKAGSLPVSPSHSHADGEFATNPIEMQV
jgi:E1A-binding protein p400